MSKVLSTGKKVLDEEHPDAIKACFLPNPSKAM